MEGARNRALVSALQRNGGLAFSSIIDEFKATLRKSQHRFAFEPTRLEKPRKHNTLFDPDHSEIAALTLSDWHGGAKISLEESSGLNKYGSIIMANRAYAVIEKFKRIFRGHQTMYNIEKIWLPILGDMINGSIHPELVLTNDLLDVPAAVLVARLLIIAILELLTLGVPIEADCIVGNHPRLLAKMPSKKQAHMSYDWLIYTMVAQYFESYSNVTIRIHPGQFGLVTHKGHRYIVEHGYGASTDTLPARLREMFDSPVYRAATGMEGTSIDCVVNGDKHKALSTPNHKQNGALCGSDEYGMSLRLKPIPAIQQMFGISQRQVTTFHYDLDVTSIISENADNPMSEYATQFMQQNAR